MTEKETLIKEIESRAEMRTFTVPVEGENLCLIKMEDVREILHSYMEDKAPDR